MASRRRASRCGRPCRYFVSVTLSSGAFVKQGVSGQRAASTPAKTPSRRRVRQHTRSAERRQRSDGKNSRHLKTQAAAKADEVFAPAPGSLDGRTVLITGANTGLGLESAARLAAAGADVVVTARTDAKAQQTVAEIERRTGRRVAGVSLDLADLESVKTLPTRLPKSVSKIDVLLENAGVMAIPERLTTKDGFERQIGVNHLGHYALVASLLPLLEKSKAFRIVAVSSSANQIANSKSITQALDSNLDPTYGAWTNYGLSKVFNILFVEELRRRLPSTGTAVAVHPGVVQTDLSRYLVQGVDAAESGVSQTATMEAMSPLQQKLMEGVAKFILPVSLGANGQVRLAAEADLAADPGGPYFDGMKQGKPNAAADDTVLAKRLWDLSEKLTGATIKL